MKPSGTPATTYIADNSQEEAPPLSMAPPNHPAVKMQHCQCVRDSQISQTSDCIMPTDACDLRVCRRGPSPAVMQMKFQMTAMTSPIQE
eukprot:scaffold1471_cov413-Prasinococcus_capsulatus_cf.AAC.25